MNPRCNSDACRQGRIDCPTPLACRILVDEEDEPGQGGGCLVWPLAIIGVVLGILAVVHFILR